MNCECGNHKSLECSVECRRLSPNNLTATYIVCDHNWSFLEGEKRLGHALKAGRHVFPFQLQIGGSLPSSISTNVFGGASVSYKLRAHVVRPGLSHDLRAKLPISIIRSFVSEALEYQQTLEIENTWPGKVMYSILLPHKAWAAGDTIIAPIKLSSLSKGVHFTNIVTTVNETTNIYSRIENRVYNRVIATARHELNNGKSIAAGSITPTTEPISVSSTIE